MSFEIERKFLVNKDLWSHKGWHATTIRQGYFKVECDLSIRIRISTYALWKQGFVHECTTTFKTPKRGLVRTEIETKLEHNAAETLLALCQTKMQKVRYHDVVNGRYWVVDLFDDGRLVAEIELDNTEEEFERPFWLGEEVTGDPMYSNETIASVSGVSE